MDLLKDAAKNLNLYEVKAYVRKAQNVAMNLTEMESKVREATNNEPWGASSTLMSQIAAGTYNYREREEIVAFIFRRFTEKAANEWRQIYKSLQLLEYLIKNGSERIIDDVRANVSLIQMLKSFHYIDSKGRDQGINVRNKSKTLIAFLNDDNQIRTERKKARQNAKKFGGVASIAMGGSSAPSFGSSSSYGGSYDVEDDDLQSNRVYGDGGVYGERFADTAEEFNLGSTSRASNASPASAPVSGATAAKSKSKSKSKPSTATTTTTAATTPSKDLIGDLLDFDGNAGGSKSAVTNEAEDDDDEFDDFVGAPASSGQAQQQYQPPQQQYQPQQQQASLFQGQPASNSQYQQQASLFQAQPVANSQAPQVQKTQKDDPFKDLLSGFKAPTTKTTNNTNTTTSANNTSYTNGDFDLL